MREKPKGSIRNIMTYRKLYRSRTNRVLGGVCAGIGEYLEIDPIIIRILALVLLFSLGTGILLYICAWILIPQEPEDGEAGDPIISHP